MGERQWAGEVVEGGAEKTAERESSATDQSRMLGSGPCSARLIIRRVVWASFNNTHNTPDTFEHSTSPILPTLATPTASRSAPLCTQHHGRARGRCCPRLLSRILPFSQPFPPLSALQSSTLRRRQAPRSPETKAYQVSNAHRRGL